MMILRNSSKRSMGYRMTGVFIFTSGAVCGACFGIFIAALMAIASRESESRMKENALETCPSEDLCPAEDCIGCEDTGCILHPGEDD